MLTINVILEGTAPIAFGAPITTKKNTGENHDAFEERTWRERMHQDADGLVFITPMALKNCLSKVAQFLGETVPGKGKATYTRHFVTGVMVAEPMPLMNGGGKRVKAADVKPNRLFVPSDGKRGGGTRVWKNFPVIPQWSTTATIYVRDPLLVDKPEKVQEYLEHAGKFIGLGSLRMENNGYFGGFKVTSFEVA